MEKIIYVPLDERPCNYICPQILAEMTDNIEILVPPLEMLGKKKEPSDCEAIWNWIFENASKCSYAILSVDTLLYGNIINSRIHHKTITECEDGLKKFRKLKSENPNMKIHAFNLVARVADYNNSGEDPDYWENYGHDICSYTCISDKLQRGICSDCDRKEFAALSKSIPSEFLDDFIARRKVDRFTNLYCVDLVKENVFDILTIPKDDTAEFGYASMDQYAIAKKVREELLMNRVLVYPGADEIGCVLFARVFNLIKNYTPRVYLRYSSINGAYIVPHYEDRPLGESIKSQITSVGGVLEDCAYRSDCMLAVNSPGKNTIESDQQWEKDITFSSYINLDEFMSYIRYYAKTYDKAIGLAEVSVTNGCENECMEYARITGIYELLQSVGGWNTSQNTIGMVLAHTVISSYYDNFKHRPQALKISREFMLKRLVADWLCQSNVLYKFLLQTRGEVDPYHLDNNEQQAINYFDCELKKMLKEKFSDGLFGCSIELTNVSFHWNGAFYFDFDISLV